MICKNDVYDYQDRFIYQDSEAFKFSLDSILLAEFANSEIKANIGIDLCSGNAVVPLILSTYLKCKLYAVELQDYIAHLANLSVKENHLEKQIVIINDNIKNVLSYFDAESIDFITCNPPYFKYYDSDKVTSDNEAKRIARHEISMTLEDVFIVSSRLLKNQGALYLVHRSQRIDDIFVLANKYNIGVKIVQFVNTKKENGPTIVLVKCVKNSNNQVLVKNQLCVENVVTYQNIFKEEI